MRPGHKLFLIVREASGEGVQSVCSRRGTGEGAGQS